MCRCTPNIRTPFCGKPGCEGPPEWRALRDRPKGVTVKATHDLQSVLSTMKSAKKQGIPMAIWDRDIAALENAIETIEAIRRPLIERPGYHEGNKRDELQRDLNALATKHKLFGCVLVEFTRDMRVGVRTVAETDLFLAAMDKVATEILIDIDDGRHDPPLELLPTEGNG